MIRQDRGHMYVQTTVDEKMYRSNNMTRGELRGPNNNIKTRRYRGNEHRYRCQTEGYIIYRVISRPVYVYDHNENGQRKL